MISYSLSSSSTTNTAAAAAAATMLSIHSFSLRWNPWHDDHLKHPLISSPGDLQGATRETLKVLWRNLSNDQIATTLMETK